MWIKGQGVGALSKTMIKNKKLTAMSVDHLKSEIKPVFKGNRLSFKVNINSEAHLAENWNTTETAIDKNI